MDYTGSVVIKGDFIRDFTEKQMDDYRKKRVGLIFQNYNLISHMTIKENIEIAMTMSDISKETRSERADDLLKMIGLLDYAKKLPNQLSGGQKQRVAIARALANNPTIILADEPTGALDSQSAEIVMQILKKIAQSGKLVIIVTHSEKVASKINGDSIVATVGEVIELTIGEETESFTISGIYENENTRRNRGGLSAYISYSAMETIIGEENITINTLYIDATESSYVAGVKSDLVALGYTVSQEETAYDNVLKYIDMGTSVLTAIGAISLVVSAIMVFIVLYISVTERMKEIGILRAIGARRSDIKKMFVFEAGMLGLIGGVLAVAICLVITIMVNIICLSTIKYSLISYNVIYYLLGIVMSVVIGILAGIAPSTRAADLDPVESLRAE